MNLFTTPGQNPMNINTQNLNGILPLNGGQLNTTQMNTLLNNNNPGVQMGQEVNTNTLQNMVPNGVNMNTGTGILGDLNFEGIGNILSGIGSLGQIYTALRSIGIAEDQLDFQRDAFNKNLANQTQSYNTSLEDRIRARYHTEGRTAQDVDDYLAKHSL